MLRRKALASAAFKKEPSRSKPPQVAESSLLEQEKAALDFEISIFRIFQYFDSENSDHHSVLHL
jgi:hypothetical protein